ncbi:hypothetical protein [Mesorhizobium sp. AR07]|nr:hypothetical protein [Mesorhizobium sp. AR07]
MLQQQIQTLAVLVGINVVMKDIKRLQAHADTHGLKVRPHIKTH